jgi:hypothetical protein
VIPGGGARGGPTITEDPLLERFVQFADTIVLPNNVSLQLWGEFEKNRLVTHRLRYSRTDSKGQVATDVMLGTSQEPPK